MSKSKTSTLQVRYRKDVLCSDIEISRRRFPTNSTFLLVSQGDEAEKKHSGYLWHCQDCEAGWVTKRGLMRYHKKKKLLEIHRLFPFGKTSFLLKDLDTPGKHLDVGVEYSWGRSDGMAPGFGCVPKDRNEWKLNDGYKVSEKSGTEDKLPDENHNTNTILQEGAPDEVLESISDEFSTPDENGNVDKDHVAEQNVASEVPFRARQSRRKRRCVNYEENNEEEKNDISGEDSDGDQTYNPCDNEQGSEDDEYETNFEKDDGSFEKPPDKKRRLKTKKGIIDDSDCGSSDDEQKEERREKKKNRRIRMEAEKELGKSLIKEWDFQEGDEVILKRLRREIWLNSSRSQLMDGSETGYNKSILDKLEQGEPLTNSESYFGPGVKTIETYIFGLKKILNVYNRRKLQLFPWSRPIRLADFFKFKCPEQVIPENPEFLIYEDQSVHTQCQMIQGHTALLKLIFKETQGGSSFANFLPRDEQNPELPKQNFSLEEKEKAMESKDRFGMMISNLISGSKDIASRTRKKADAQIQRQKLDKSKFQGVMLPEPQEVILKFLKSEYVR